MDPTTKQLIRNALADITAAENELTVIHTGAKSELCKKLTPAFERLHNARTFLRAALQDADS